jgi:hypothetical protein
MLLPGRASAVECFPNKATVLLEPPYAVNLTTGFKLAARLQFLPRTYARFVHR